MRRPALAEQVSTVEQPIPSVADFDGWARRDGRVNAAAEDEDGVGDGDDNCVGVANGTNASDADAIAESAFFHFDLGADLNIDHTLTFTSLT